VKVAIRGTRLFVDVEGAAWRWQGARVWHAPPLFVLHGGPGGNHLDLKRSLGFLQRWFQLFFVDQRGCGFSGRCPKRTLTIQNNAADIEALRRTLGFETISIAGVSYGGMVTCEYAARYPNRVGRLFLLGTTGSGAFLQAAQEYLREHGSPEQVRAAERLWRGAFRSQMQLRRFFEVLGPLYSRKFSLKTFHRTKRKVPMNLAALNRGFRDVLPGWNALPKLRRVKAPTFVAVGKHDWICPVSQSVALTRHLPNATLKVYRNSAHAPQVDEPARFQRDVAAFVHATRKSGRA